MTKSNKVIYWVVGLAVFAAAVSLVAGFGSRSFGSPEDIAEPAAQDGFVASLSQGDYDYPRIFIKQQGLTVTAVSAGMSDVSWKHRVLNIGDYCGPEAFVFALDSPAALNFAPSNPGIRSSNRLELPDDDTEQDFYRNRFVCFEATGTANSLDGLDWTHYESWRINLGHPVISIRAETEGGQTYLRASSSEDVTYEVVKYTVSPLVEAGSVSSENGQHLAVANHCEYDLVSGVPGARQYWGDWQSFADIDGRVLVPDDDYSYCFRATDADGNYVYLGANSSYSGRIWASQWQGRLRFNFSSTSGRVAWEVVGPLNDEVCDQEIIDGAKPNQRQHLFLLPEFWPSSSRVIELPDGSDGKYYCVQATDQLGHSSYLAAMADLRPPVITMELDTESGLLQITSDKPILNPWLVGPLARSEFENCADIFVTDANGSRTQLWWQRGERAESAVVDLVADAGKYYCAEIEDRHSNKAVKQFRIPPTPEDRYPRR